MTEHMRRVQADCERAIEALCMPDGAVATHHDIAQFLLADPTAYAEISRRSRKTSMTIEQYAANEVAWFSQWITVGLIKTSCERRCEGAFYSYWPEGHRPASQSERKRLSSKESVRLILKNTAAAVRRDFKRQTAQGTLSTEKIEEFDRALAEPQRLASAV